MKINLKSTVVYISLAITAVIAGKLLICSAPDNDLEYRKRFNDAYHVYPITMPAQLDFAGERVPLDNFEVRERIDRELLVNTYWQSQTMLNIKRVRRWFPVIEPILRKNGVPDDFVYLVVAESGLTNAISAVGATGFLQFTDAAAKKYGLEINENVDERYNVELSTEAACKYLKEAKEQFGNWTLAAASYNMGIDGLSKQIEKQRVKNYYDLLLSDETLRYLARIVAVKEILSHPATYGYNYRMSDMYAPFKYSTLEVDTAITNIADFAIGKGANYKTVKLLNPWLRSNTLPAKPGKKYYIKLLDPGFTGLIESASDSSMKH